MSDAEGKLKMSLNMLRASSRLVGLWGIGVSGEDSLLPEGVRPSVLLEGAAAAAAVAEALAALAALASFLALLEFPPPNQAFRSSVSLLGSISKPHVGHVVFPCSNHGFRHETAWII
jgi:hypothetical protein